MKTDVYPSLDLSLVPSAIEKTVPSVAVTESHVKYTIKQTAIDLYNHEKYTPWWRKNVGSPSP